ncbi:hypothetical protein [Clostridium sp. AF32-12BH]|uniref:hypothetical protein n=1 Tax=Clostridium sp. AF32-12BH TaxID=2292006 RepID=UPI000E4FF366|nr:hypothetical protein [Clostridium sp. AF32-12BH]RHP46939.1 hypothetical protein DWZ40_08520 [Clostridium sp. AF32-12BH]
MKPVVYFDFKECENDNNSVVIAKDRLKEILDEVYQAGYSDGNSSKTTITTTPWNWRGNDWMVPREITAGTPLRTNETIITCKNEKSK